MVDQRGDERHLLGWLGILISAGAMISAFFLPGGQTSLCQSGIRLACSQGEMKIDEIVFRHQRIPPDAGGVELVRTMYHEAHPYLDPTNPIYCNAEKNSWLEEQERKSRTSEMVGSTHLVRGQDDYVIADTKLSFPPSDIALDFVVRVDYREPKGPESLKIKWPAFGIAKLPGKQRFDVHVAPNTSVCRLAVLVVPFSGLLGVDTENWDSGRYEVEVRTSGDISAYKFGEFKIGPPSSPENKSKYMRRN